MVRCFWKSFLYLCNIYVTRNIENVYIAKYPIPNSYKPTTANKFTNRHARVGCANICVGAYFSARTIMMISWSSFMHVCTKLQLYSICKNFSMLAMSEHPRPANVTKSQQLTIADLSLNLPSLKQNISTCMPMDHLEWRKVQFSTLK